MQIPDKEQVMQLGVKQAAGKLHLPVVFKANPALHILQTEVEERRHKAQFDTVQTGGKMQEPLGLRVYPELQATHLDDRHNAQ